MDKWTIQRYRKPYLAVENVFLDPDRNTPTLEVGGRLFDLEGATDSAEVVRFLSELRRSDSASWRDIHHEGAAPWQELLSQLDQLALIHDAATEESRALQKLEHVIATTADAIESGLAQASIQVRTRVLEDLDLHLGPWVHDLAMELDSEALLAWQPAPKRAPDPFEHENFFTLTVALQARYWRTSGPVSLVAAWAVLQALRHRNGLGLSLPNEVVSHVCSTLVNEVGAGLYSWRDLLASLKSLAYSIVKATGADAAIVCKAPPRPAQALTGINFLMEAERITDEALERLGQSRFMAELGKPRSNVRKQLAMGCYIEEYHVTCRFVEMITPMMAKRLSPELRQRIYRYFEEEVGHETFELATCTSLGIREEALATCLPLPLRTAFVDTFTAISERDPIGYLLSIFVTEGMLGQKSPLNELLAQIDEVKPEYKLASVRHEETNDMLNHSSLSRHMMREISSVPPRTQERALRSLLYLVELNHRGWDEVYDHYATPVFAHHRWYDVSQAVE